MRKRRFFFDGDPLLMQYQETIENRYNDYRNRLLRLTGHKNGGLSAFANGYLYYGLHQTKDRNWVFREWLPNAERVFLIGDFSQWQEDDRFMLKRKNCHGDFELTVPPEAIKHGQLYRMKVYWDKGSGERLPAWCRRAVQDPETMQFSAQVWNPEKPYQFKAEHFRPRHEPLLIYESHIGMATTEERVGTYDEFRTNVLPRIVESGYNAIQLMAIHEHPYYGSFGYHVSNFFAPSSRFGTPEQLKRLIDEAHQQGIAVIMDLVHSHAVRNTCEGLGDLSGEQSQFFHTGNRGIHPVWDSLCFNYGSDDVVHFLLSNCKYWLEEFRFDGFRFDGVTSMIYLNHGLGKDYKSYADYYNPNLDPDAICYLTLANQLIHEVNPNAITIAEEVSGIPGLASPVNKGGMGFDYRLAMGIPDYWIRFTEQKTASEWNPEEIFWTLQSRRSEEKNISYVESHDQALVGDKTLIFRLIDSDMYWHFRKGDETPRVTNGIALHKMITLITMATINGGYLNFMGNEFGHPEWIDFPREGNGWSYKHAIRRWDLVDRNDLWYSDINEWNIKTTKLLRSIPNFCQSSINLVISNTYDQVLAFQRQNYLFIFNFSHKSYRGYRIPCAPGAYTAVLSNATEQSPIGPINCPQSGDGSFIYIDLPALSAHVLCSA